MQVSVASHNAATASQPVVHAENGRVGHFPLWPVPTRSSVTAEIARVGGGHAVQGHSRWLAQLVPIESLYATSY